MEKQRRRLRGGTGGDRPPQKVRWRGRICFYPPQYLENILQIYNVNKIRIKEKEDKTHVTVIDIQALYPIPVYCATLSRLT